MTIDDKKRNFIENLVGTSGKRLAGMIDPKSMVHGMKQGGVTHKDLNELLKQQNFNKNFKHQKNAPYYPGEHKIKIMDESIERLAKASNSKILTDIERNRLVSLGFTRQDLEYYREYLFNKMAENRAEVIKHEHEIVELEFQRRMIKTLQDVLFNDPKNLKISRVQQSLTHTVAEAVRTDNFSGFGSSNRVGMVNKPDWVKRFDESIQIILLQHDWASVLDRLEIDEFNLPFPFCSFELKVNGLHVCAVIEEDDSNDLMKLNATMALSLFIKFEHLWVFVGPFATGRMGSNSFMYPSDGKDVKMFKSETSIYNMCCARTPDLIGVIMAQIQAASVAIEAEVVETDRILADEHVNRKRRANGKCLLRDYYVLKLKQRRPYHVEARPGETTGSKRRLHFRRGHWRHYHRDTPQEYKQWIKWMLVGDPNLGFVHKQYAI